MRVLASRWPLIASYVVGALSSPVLLWALGSLLTATQRRRDSVRAARRVLAVQLDPLLKAADELHGKLRSLAEEDFAEFGTIPAEGLPAADLVNLCSTLYLFAQFWGRLEILRRESFHSELALSKPGGVLLRFLRCLESKRVRLVDRAWQRAIGESVLPEGGGSGDLLSFKAFVERYEASARIREWLQPLEGVIRQTKYRRARKRVLQYGVVVHALIDTLDPKHYTTRDRPGYPNKLARRAKRELTGRVFGVYLPDVRRPEKYTGIKRRCKIKKGLRAWRSPFGNAISPPGV